MEQTVAKTKEEIWHLAMSGMSPLNDIKAAAFPAMDEYAKQQATEFFKWYGVKMIEFMQYFQRKRENPEIYSIPDDYDRFIQEFEGNTVEGLYKTFYEWQQLKLKLLEAAKNAETQPQ